MLDTKYVVAYGKALAYIAYGHRYGEGDDIGTIRDYELTALVAEAFDMPRLLIATKIFELRRGRNNA